MQISLKSAKTWETYCIESNFLLSRKNSWHHPKNQSFKSTSCSHQPPPHHHHCESWVVASVCFNQQSSLITAAVLPFEIKHNTNTKNKPPTGAIMLASSVKTLFKWAGINFSGQSYLVGGHLTDRVSCLQGLQLVQAPVQFLQCLSGQFLVGLLCRGKTGGQGVSKGPLQRASGRSRPGVPHPTYS